MSRDLLALVRVTTPVPAVWNAWIAALVSVICLGAVTCPQMQRTTGLGTWGGCPRTKTVHDQSSQKRSRKRTISRTAKEMAHRSSVTNSVMVATSSGLGRTEKDGCECHSPR